MPLDRYLTREIENAGGCLPDRFAPRPWTVATPAGSRPVPTAVQALFAVEWPEGHRLAWKFGTRPALTFAGCEVGAEVIAEDRPRAWFAIAGDESGARLLVDLDEEAGGNPRIYRIDSEGEPAPWGNPLSAWFVDLTASSPMLDFGRACARGHLSVVREKCRSIGTGPVAGSGLTPLHLAVISGSVDTVQTVLDAGADPNAAMRTEDRNIWWRYMRDDTRYPEWGLSSDETPLHAALAHFVFNDRDRHTRAIVRALLAAGADPNRTAPNARLRGETEGWSPTDVAAHHLVLGYGPEPELRACMDLLLEAGGRLGADFGADFGADLDADFDHRAQA